MVDRSTRAAIASADMTRRLPMTTLARRPVFRSPALVAVGLPLRLLLAQGGDWYEMVINDRFHFHVEIRHRLIGLIVNYRGWLEIRPEAGHS